MASHNIETHPKKAASTHKKENFFAFASARNDFTKVNFEFGEFGDRNKSQK